MMVCGLDIATQTGWCLANGDNYKTGSFNSKKVGKRTVSGEAERNANFRQWLWTFLQTNEVQVVAIEAPIKGNVEFVEKDDFDQPILDENGKPKKKTVTNYDAKAVAAYLIGCAKEVCFSLNIPFHMVQPNSWWAKFNKNVPRHTKEVTSKKTGETRVVDESNKDVTRRSCELRKIEVRTFDAADATGIAHWLQAELKERRSHAPAGPLFAEGAI